MSKNISVTVPVDDYDSLVAASDMLNSLAVKIGNGATCSGDCGHKDETEVKVVNIAEHVHTTETIDSPVDEEEVETETAAPAGVELDKAGLPWDVRIHSGGAKKMKADGYWKKARGVADELVVEVEAELRAAMAASPAAPVETAAPAPVETTAAAPVPPVETAAPAPVDEDYYIIGAGQFTRAELKVAGWADEAIDALPVAPVEPATTAAPVTFAELMQKITGAGLTPDTVLAAVNKSGLVTTALLAARPDLVQGVHDELFPA